MELETEEILDIEFIKTKASEYKEESDEYTGMTATDTTPSVYEGSFETETITSAGTEDYGSDKESKHRMKYTESGDIPNVESERVLQSIVYQADSVPSLVTGEVKTQTLDWDEDEGGAGLPEEEVSGKHSHISMPKVPEKERESEVEEATIKVWFRTDTDETMSTVFKVSSTIADVKKRLNAVFRIDAEDIELTFKGAVCDGLQRPADLADGSDSVELGVRSKRDDFLAPGEFSLYTPTSHRITIRVPRDVGGFEVVRIVVENQAFIKQWLGGYRNLKTKLEYHHASVQTLPRRRPDGSLPQRSRDTQTPVFPLKDTGDDTTVSKATQMWRTDHYIPTVHDRIVKTDPDRFKPVTTLMGLVLLFQTVLRLKRFAKKFLRERQARLDAIKLANCKKITQEVEKARQNEQLEGNEKLIMGSTYPLHRDDFYLLYLLIGNWWRREDKKIKEVKSGASRKAALVQLLEKEIGLVSVVEQHRIKAKKELLSKQDMYFIETCARPIIFRNERGIMSSIDTLETQQAREYLEIVSSYVNTNVTVEARINVLCTLKHLVQSYGYPEYGQEIVELLERECDLLVIGLSDGQLKVLRNRVLQLLIYMLHCETVNPACKNFSKPGAPKTDDRHYLCKYCGKLKQACDYNVHVKLISFSMCMSCEWMKNIGQERANLTPFARILAQVRQSEMLKCCYASVCYVLQPVGMCYLVNRIWKCRSIMSDQTDLNRLRMVRFRQNEDWSPWNCILLTVEESVIHNDIEDVNEFYAPFLLSTVNWRHLRAKNHFVPLLLNDRYMRESKLWFNVQDTGRFIHSSHISRFAQQDDFEYIA